MDSHSALIRLKEFQIDAHRRKIAQIQTMIAEFERLSVELDREIHIDETRSGISDPAHFAYPTYAKAARQRRDNLRRSIAELRQQLDAERATLAETTQDFEAIAPDRRRASPPPTTPSPPVAPTDTGFDFNQAS